jgi:peptidoglycan/LPS O-acetylase OafA/YrhL
VTTGRVEYPQQINALTSLRYLAAGWVLLFHLKEFTRFEGLIQNPFVMHGYLGVDFFFVLSGFVLAHVYKRDVDAARFNYWGFISKRLGRIYPMHLFTLGLFIVLGLVSLLQGLTYDVWDPAQPFRDLDRGQLIRALVAHITLIHAWGSTPGLQFNLPSWSISAEWFAYLMFPVFLLILRALRGGPGLKLVWAAGLFFAMAVGTELAMGLELTEMSWNIGILRITPEFFLGVALYNFGQHCTVGRRGAILGLWLSVAAIVASLAASAWIPGAAILAIPLVVFGLSGVVFFAADGDRYGAFPPLSQPFFVLLGEISYSVYMLHQAVMVVLFGMLLPAFRPAEPALAVAVVAGGLVLTTALSWLSYKFIELPGRSVIVGAARKLNQPAVSPAE